jgi:4'-phosphopantetheinyl transferase
VDGSAGSDASAEATWTRLAASTPLSADELRVYRVGLDAADPAAPDAYELLSPAERRRAASYGSQQRAARFVVARAMLRRLLGEQLGLDPGSVPIASPRHHKPRIDNPGTLLDLRFSTSRSGSTFLCAMAVAAEVGVDVETGRTEAATAAIVGTAFTSEEVAQTERLPVPLRHAAILRQWTRKEAILKGLGSGLRIPPATLALGVDPAASGAALPVAAAGRRWHLWDLAADDGAAAVVIEGAPRRVCLIER